MQSLLDAQELIGFDAWLTLVDLSVEAYDFGQEVIFPVPAPPTPTPTTPGSRPSRTTTGLRRSIR